MDHLGVNVHQWILEKQVEICSSLDELSSVNKFHEEVQGGMDMDGGIDMNNLQGDMEDL